MSADYFPTGPVELYVNFRRSQKFYYLGTAIGTPHIDANIIYRPVPANRVDPGPYNKMLCTEQHLVSVVINRPNWSNYVTLRDVGSNVLAATDLVRRLKPGRLVMGAYDVRLFMRYALPATPPDSAHTGRLYLSACLLDYDEDAPSRVKEVGLLFECNPLPKYGKLTLYSEDETDFPTVTPE